MFNFCTQKLPFLGNDNLISVAYFHKGWASLWPIWPYQVNLIFQFKCLQDHWSNEEDHLSHLALYLETHFHIQECLLGELILAVKYREERFFKQDVHILCTSFFQDVLALSAGSFSCHFMSKLEVHINTNVLQEWNKKEKYASDRILIQDSFQHWDLSEIVLL